MTAIQLDSQSLITPGFSLLNVLFEGCAVGLHFGWIGLNCPKLGWIWLNWPELAGLSLHELGWTGLKLAELAWILLNWPEIGWTGVRWAPAELSPHFFWQSENWQGWSLNMHNLQGSLPWLIVCIPQLQRKLSHTDWIQILSRFFLPRRKY